MKKCKACMSEIDDKAKKCPKCGSDQRNWFARHPVLTVLLVLLLIGMVGSASGDNSSTTSEPSDKMASDEAVMETSETEDAMETDKMEKEATVVDLGEFVGEFDKNQLAAEDKYEGQLVQLTGYIGNISEDLVGNYFVRLQPSNEDLYLGTAVQCFFEDRASLVDLENGQQVTLMGTVDTQVVNVIIEECTVVEQVE